MFEQMIFGGFEIIMLGSQIFVDRREMPFALSAHSS